jgi:hypothetical protein
MCVTNLKRPENGRRGFEDTVDAVGHVETVRPVVVGHLWRQMFTVSRCLLETTGNGMGEECWGQFLILAPRVRECSSLGVNEEVNNLPGDKVHPWGNVLPWGQTSPMGKCSPLGANFTPRCKFMLMKTGLSVLLNGFLWLQSFNTCVYPETLCFKT